VDSVTRSVQVSGWGDSGVPLSLRGEPEAVLSVLRQRENDENSLRTQLASCLNDLIRERKLTQTVASAIFGIPQPHISELRNYKLSRFSSERLLRFITLLDQDIEVVIRPKTDKSSAGVISVILAN
jgi:predicted XRE-type DNA-binding protein